MPSYNPWIDIFANAALLIARADYCEPVLMIEPVRDLIQIGTGGPGFERF